jgi:hypothetical protein
MTLKEFIKEYIGHNSMVRLLYKEDSGGHRIILNDWDEVSMDWEVLKGVGVYAPYINHKVKYITSILVGGPYPEAINIVIEEIPLDQLREMKLDKLL